jgi:hypothetical protein
MYPDSSMYILTKYSRQFSWGVIPYSTVGASCCEFDDKLVPVKELDVWSN